MKSAFRGASASHSPCFVNLRIFAARRSASRACRRPARGAVDALHPPHLDFFGGRLGRHVVIERAGLGFLDVLIDQDADDDVLEAAEAAADADAVAFADGAVRLGVVAVHFDLAALAGALGFRAWS